MHAFTFGPEIGLTRAEAERASLLNYIAAAVRNDRRELQFFAEVSAAVARLTGDHGAGVVSYRVPHDALVGVAQRDLKTTAGPSGGYLVESQTGGFAGTLRAASLIGQLPLTQLSDLQGNVVIPRDALRGTVGWVSAEGVTAAPDIAPTWGQLSMTPKTAHGSVSLSRQWVLQTTASARQYVDRVLAETMAAGIDAALLAGTGASGQPLGLFGTAGINSRAGSTIAWSDITSMLKPADGWDASSSVAWVAGVDAAEVLRTRARATGLGFIAENGLIDGRPLLVSRSAPAAGLIVAPWSQVWFASWGGLEVAVDTSTAFASGGVVVRLRWPVDFGVSRPASISVATGVS